ncbi:MAG: hypothetical protein ABSC36_03000 [Gaiellaceae bacterium]
MTKQAAEYRYLPAALVRDPQDDPIHPLSIQASVVGRNRDGKEPGLGNIDERLPHAYLADMSPAANLRMATAQPRCGDLLLVSLVDRDST